MREIKDLTVYDSLYALGDTHGNNLQIVPHLLQTDKESNKCILHCGDFGVGFIKPQGEQDMLERLNKRLAKYRTTMYVIRGNHDDPAYFEGHHDYSHITLVKDHTTIELNLRGEKKVVYMNGGAVSVDRINRIPSKSYWWNEGVKALDEYQVGYIPSNIDIVITHTRPRGVFPVTKDGIEYWLLKDMALERDLDIELEVITDIFDALRSKNPQGFKHYYGHFHTSNFEKIGEVEHHLLDIDELKEIR